MYIYDSIKSVINDNLDFIIDSLCTNDDLTIITQWEEFYISRVETPEQFCLLKSNIDEGNVTENIHGFIKLQQTLYKIEITQK